MKHVETKHSLVMRFGPAEIRMHLEHTEPAVLDWVLKLCDALNEAGDAFVKKNPPPR